jgi:membrane protein YqaA with SNARE-associated domain
MPKWSAVKKAWKNEDVRGWMLWAAVSLVLFWPCARFLYAYTYSTMPPATKLASAAFMAAISGGVISWGINEAAFRMRKRRAASEKRKSRKKDAKR